MTRLDLLRALKEFTKEVTADLIMPTRPQKGDTEQKYRSADVHLMRLGDSSVAETKAPYVIHQLITGKDSLIPGQQPESQAVVRSICCVFSEDEEEGGLMLLNLIERQRIELLRNIVIGGQFQLDLQAGLETFIYPEDTAPYYVGELIGTWDLPTIKREVRCSGYNE